MIRNDERPSVDVGNMELERLSSYAIKAELYIVSLTFSILGLSIQFPVASGIPNSLIAKFQAPEWIIPISQTVGWFMLVISGIVGVKVLRNVSIKFNILMSKYRSLKKAVASASSFEQLKVQVFSDVFEDCFSEVSQQNGWLFPVQGYSLVFGLLFLVFSRILATPLL